MDDWQKWAKRTVATIADGIGDALTGDNALVSVCCSEEGVEVVVHCTRSERRVTFIMEFEADIGGVVIVERIGKGGGTESDRDRALDPSDGVREDIAGVLGGRLGQ